MRKTYFSRRICLFLLSSPHSGTGYSIDRRLGPSEFVQSLVRGEFRAGNNTHRERRIGGVTMVCRHSAAPAGMWSHPGPDRRGAAAVGGGVTPRPARCVRVSGGGACRIISPSPRRGHLTDK